MASANDSSKRRKLLGDASTGVRLLSDLPSAVLTSVANYLDAPSRLFFAAALAINQNEAAASDERNTAIVNHEWDTLDFGDIEKDIAVRLSDGDISAVLMCIDAMNKLKRLKLTNCISITGVGLQPLRGSTMIEQIDLSLVGKHQNPDLDPVPPISCDFVVPILDSIIEREGCLLMHLQFPKVWRRARNVQFGQFLQRYDEMMLNRGIISCDKCNRNVAPENPTRNGWMSYHGRQNYTCCECLKYYCDECSYVRYLRNCDRCERKICADCQKVRHCGECEEEYCVDCNEWIECSVCNDRYLCKDCTCNEWRFCCKCEKHFCGGSYGNGCSDHAEFYCQSCQKDCCNDCEEEYGWPKCSKCSVELCDDCNEKKKGKDAIRMCKICDTYFCGGCLIHLMEESNEICVGCNQIAGRVLIEENEKLENENVSVKAENRELKQRNNFLRDRNKELEEKMKQISIRKC